MRLKQGLKNIAKTILYNSGLTELMLHLSRGKLCILCYHRISDPDNGLRYLAVPQDVFEQQILFLKKYFTILPFSDAMERFKAGSIKEPILVLTFDDGYADNYSYAFPVLKKHNLTATIFLTVGYIGTAKSLWWNRVADIIMNSSNYSGGFNEKVEAIEDIAHSLKKMGSKDREAKIESLQERFKSRAKGVTEEREFLNWDEIREMDRHGIDFGSHTLTHPDLTILSQEEARKEILHSKEILERFLGRGISSFAYPYGFYRDDIKKIVRQSNYLYARSSLEGFNSIGEDNFALKRIDTLIYTVRDLAVRLSCKGTM